MVKLRKFFRINQSINQAEAPYLILNKCAHDLRHIETCHTHSIPSSTGRSALLAYQKQILQAIFFTPRLLGLAYR